MSVPSPIAVTPLRSEEALAQAEAAVAAEEHQLAAAMARAEDTRAELARTLAHTRERAEEAFRELGGDAAVGEVCARLETLGVPVLGADAARERALRAREQAVEARLSSVRETKDALQRLDEQSRALTRAFDAAQARLTSVRAAQERAAKAARERAAARAAESARQRNTQAAPRQARVAMQAVIDLRSDSNFFNGFSTNLSAGGVFIATVERVPQGTVVDISLTLPGGEPLTVTGVVRWSREVDDRTPELMPGLGVQFTDLAPETARAIEAFIATREPLFYPD
ncbi:MAG: TIGR02266 family protein [Myxococcaceae bacterium]|nr:TIGR02266 family protein [Myxococcaceae bacterium]MCI0671652.1 TIGR02266 family protein [Myxococcaceae bacterium]